MCLLRCVHIVSLLWSHKLLDAHVNIIPQATDIRCRLGKYFVSTNNKKSAIEQFVEGLAFDGAHEESLELLAKCYLDTVILLLAASHVVCLSTPTPFIYPQTCAQPPGRDEGLPRTVREAACSEPGQQKRISHAGGYFVPHQ